MTDGTDTAPEKMFPEEIGKARAIMADQYGVGTAAEIGDAKAIRAESGFYHVIIDGEPTDIIRPVGFNSAVKLLSHLERLVSVTGIEEHDAKLNSDGRGFQ